MSPLKPRVPQAISQGSARPGYRAGDMQGSGTPGTQSEKGKPYHDFAKCIACAACSNACDPQAIRIFIDEGEGMLVWTLDLFDCTWCGRCSRVCPTAAMGLIAGSDFADDPEPPKRCLFALRECESCGRYFATNKEIDYANALLDQQEHADAAHARARTGLCPECKRVHDAKAAARRSSLAKRVQQ